MLLGLELMKKIQLHANMWLKEGKFILIASDDCGYSPLMLHQNSTSFSKVNFNVESETMSMNFSDTFILKYSIYLEL